MNNDPTNLDPSNPLGPGPDASDVDPAIPDALVDRFFDRELTAEDRARFTRELDSNARACERVARTHRAISMMRKGVRPPDLSEAILDRVDRVRGFVPPARRAWIRAGRLAAAVALFGVVAGAVVVRRQAPEIVALGGERTPVRDVASAACRDADGVSRLASAVRALPDALSPGLRMDPLASESAASCGVTVADTSCLTWSWSPVAASADAPSARESRTLVVVGGRVVAIERYELGTEARASVAPVSFRPRTTVRGVRNAGLSDIP